MTMVNFDLGGDLEAYVLGRIKAGYATSKAEVIRTSLMQAKQEEEDHLAVLKMQKIDAEIAAGKRKVMTEEDFLKLHPELKKHMKDGVNVHGTL